MVYSIYHMVLYSLPEGDGLLRLLVGGSRREKAIRFISSKGTSIYTSKIE